MSCQNKYKLYDRHGFTLIELLVVVLIIGILASVAMPQYFKSVEKSRSAEAVEAAESIVGAEERYYMKNGSYTNNLSDLDVSVDYLNYFYINNITGGVGGNCVAMVRNQNAGGGFGAYVIRMQYPTVPGTGAKSWTCRTGDGNTELCKSLLPQ